MTSTEGTQAVIRKITYIGGPARVGQLAQMLREEGVEVEYEPPMEQRGAGMDVAVGVVVYIITKGCDEAIKAAVRRFRERVPQAAVTIEGDDENRTGGDEQQGPR